MSADPTGRTSAKSKPSLREIVRTKTNKDTDSGNDSLVVASFIELTKKLM